VVNLEAMAARQEAALAASAECGIIGNLVPVDPAQKAGEPVLRNPAGGPLESKVDSRRRCVSHLPKDRDAHHPNRAQGPCVTTTLPKALSLPAWGETRATGVDHPVIRPAGRADIPEGGGPPSETVLCRSLGEIIRAQVREQDGRHVAYVSRPSTQTWT
jgi:hypothetical protein